MSGARAAPRPSASVVRPSAGAAAGATATRPRARRCAPAALACLTLACLALAPPGLGPARAAAQDRGALPDAPAPARPAPGAPDAAAAARAVFADPDLQAGLDRSHAPGVEDALGSLALRALRRLVSALRGLQTAAPLLFWAIVVALVLVLVLLVAHIAWTLTVAMRGLPAHVGRSGGVAEADERRRRCGELRAEARRLAAAGQHLEALRALVVALVVLVEDRRGQSVPPSATVREVLARARAAAPAALAASVAAFGAAAEAAFYGGRPVGADEVERCERLLAGFEAALARTGPTDDRIFTRAMTRTEARNDASGGPA